MDDATLKQKVEEAVGQKVLDREPFTTVDISHPIIAEDKSVRHRQVRTLVEEIVGRGDLDEGMFTSSPITVYPQPGKPVTARLFHPDDPTFDINSYAATHQKLNRGQAALGPAVTRGYDMTDDEGDDGSDDGVTHVTSTPTGAPVTKQCFIQPKQGSLNIPSIIVKGAGFNNGDKFGISLVSGAIRIERASSGSQVVDKEGRIRLHGKSIASKDDTNTCTATVVSPQNGDAYIEVL